MKKRIGLVMGDPCGVGPEIVAKLLSHDDIHEKAVIVVIGDRTVLTAGERIANCSVPIQVVEDLENTSIEERKALLIDNPPIDFDSLIMGKVSKLSGVWQLECLSLVLELCRDGKLDGFCFAPLNKEAMHLAGLTHEDELGFFIEKLGLPGPFGMMNTLGNLWTSRVTSHVPLKEVSSLITKASVIEAIQMADSTLKSAGYKKPKIAVAGFNPHAGEGGGFGNEESEEILPAITDASSSGINVSGPFPADTLFLKGRDGEYDAIVTMYHDQGQIAMKLMGFDHGVTVHAGMPFPLATSAHGSAFDIAGKGIAQSSALEAALNVVCSMADNRDN